MCLKINRVNKNMTKKVNSETWFFNITNKAKRDLFVNLKYIKHISKKKNSQKKSDFSLESITIQEL